MSNSRDQEWDYGLDPGESFEPRDDADEPFDPAQPHVMTVLGPVDPGALGFTLPHEHLIYGPAGNRDTDQVLDDIAAAASELEGFFATGGRAIVDVTTPREGRNLDDLLWIAQRVPVHIIAATGGALEGQGSSATIEALARRIIAELTVGIGSRNVRVGITRAGESGDELTAAALAHGTVRAPVSVVANDERDARRQHALLVEHGVQPASIILGYREAQFDVGLLTKLLESGSHVLFLGWSSSSDADAKRASLIAELVEAGLGDRVLISGGSASRSNWLSYGGGPGFVHFIDRLPLQLMDTGMSASDVRRIFFENPARALTIGP